MCSGVLCACEHDTHARMRRSSLTHARVRRTSLSSSSSSFSSSSACSDTSMRLRSETGKIAQSAGAPPLQAPLIPFEREFPCLAVSWSKGIQGGVPLSPSLPIPRQPKTAHARTAPCHGGTKHATNQPCYTLRRCNTKVQPNESPTIYPQSPASLRSTPPVHLSALSREP